MLVLAISLAALLAVAAIAAWAVLAAGYRRRVHRHFREPSDPNSARPPVTPPEQPRTRTRTASMVSVMTSGASPVPAAASPVPAAAVSGPSILTTATPAAGRRRSAAAPTAMR
ncbi:hypothetical protein [Nocardia sp. alder85J]|uniref:hypothetical protein n=1 Tax=Nocardia sp. alder85J TaxID=2862949 RepID=UPI001CD2FB3A|nr:hypothetical protein [Nocardia sp. alder85J]MCX4092949.1 hypothetical protein [Nocardia sp. alder85J]